ncbi:undecaprenyl-diphosphate phosphatase [Patescibacteria group bacterium]|nr:undecaprenyl-diphosphate phosphatase [Patescibacteria group bacterium]
MLIYLVLGIIQGIFEWLPISSEGVVALFSQWLIADFNPIDIALFLHLGTLLAVLVYFFKDWKNLLLFKDLKLLKFLTITTIISAGIGFLLYIFVTTMVLGASLLFLTGFGLLFTAYFHKKKKKLKIKDNWLAVIVGLLQGLAVIPGLSRSGATIFGLSLAKDEPKEILKLSYLMSGPAILGSSIFLVAKSPSSLNAWPALITAFVVGLFSLKILFRISERINFFKFALVFSIFCLIGGLISLVF